MMNNYDYRDSSHKMNSQYGFRHKLNDINEHFCLTD